MQHLTIFFHHFLRYTYSSALCFRRCRAHARQMLNVQLSGGLLYENIFFLYIFFCISLLAASFYSCSVSHLYMKITFT